MKRTKEEQLISCFSKYVKTAIKRARRDYLSKIHQTDNEEYLTGDEIISYYEEGTDCERMLPEEIECVPWEAESIRIYLKEQIDEKLNRHLWHLTDNELIILFARVYCQYPFLIIAQRMGQKQEKVASSYYYALKKLKKRWNDEF
ncbi:MAG: hypothetical protein ACLUFH_00590 [Monoglobales bacterium]